MKSETPQWVCRWRENITSLESVLDLCQIQAKDRSSIDMTEQGLLSVPLRLVAKMRKGDIFDPLFRQFVPLVQGSDLRKGIRDPLGEERCVCTGSLLQKYSGRALILASNACAMRCQFCFRRHYTIPVSDFHEELEWLAHTTTVEEIILSGGDPLALQTSELEALLRKIGVHKHVQRIRIHTRFPIGIPERIDEEFINMLQTIDQQLLFVLHTNHANELDEEVGAAMGRLRQIGAILLSQSVLLRGINNSFEALSTLFRRLVEIKVIPYYLHQLDPVLGVMHYEVSVSEAMELMRRLHETLPGYMVPRYVQEIQGEKGKNIFSTYPAKVQ